jgi:NAD(P)-dependent dehydrogenase (short-subunit alcohol dehydrogenase family)
LGSSRSIGRARAPWAETRAAYKEWNKTMGRTSDPEDFGPLPVYLASPAAAYVTGAAYVIDSGYTLW